MIGLVLFFQHSFSDVMTEAKKLLDLEAKLRQVLEEMADSTYRRWMVAVAVLGQLVEQFEVGHTVMQPDFHWNNRYWCCHYHCHLFAHKYLLNKKAKKNSSNSIHNVLSLNQFQSNCVCECVYLVRVHGYWQLDIRPSSCRQIDLPRWMTHKLGHFDLELVRYSIVVGLSFDLSLTTHKSVGCIVPYSVWEEQDKNGNGNENESEFSVETILNPFD